MRIPKFWLAAVLCACASAAAFAEPLAPLRDDEVIERLPPRVAPRSAERPAATTVAQATAWATQLVREARRRGDPRPAGQAIALLGPWANDAAAPAALVVTLADAEQHLHDFDAALGRLEALVQREPDHHQAWLMLATLHRVQGRYAASDQACERLRQLLRRPHGEACLAENDALRGRTAAARGRLKSALAAARLPAVRGWLLTTLAELEERGGDDRAAEAAYRAALEAEPDGYTALAYADLLIRTGRGDDARQVLRTEPDSDAVLLRIAMAAPQDETGRTAARTVLERFAQADLHVPRRGHERERAMAALHLQGDPAAALRWARLNVQAQREPLDLLLFVASARAAGDAGAADDARRLIEEIGLVDRRHRDAR